MKFTQGGSWYKLRTNLEGEQKFAAHKEVLVISKNQLNVKNFNLKLREFEISPNELE